MKSEKISYRKPMKNLMVVLKEYNHVYMKSEKISNRKPMKNLMVVLKQYIIMKSEQMS
jgi:hypothetical protein